MTMYVEMSLIQLWVYHVQRDRVTKYFNTCCNVIFHCKCAWESRSKSWDWGSLYNGKNKSALNKDIGPMLGPVQLTQLRTWSFWKGWNFWLFWISKHSNLWLLQIFLFKFQLLEMSVRPLKKSINIFKHDEKIYFLKIWYLDVSWHFKKIDVFFLATTIATAKLGIFCTSMS